MKVLADPRRIRILELLGDQERTTKQVAEILGEPPTRLYHHMAALARVGLIRLARTRQNRGAQEKYYVAVARTFGADPKLFASPGGPQAAGAAGTVATQALDLTAEDLRRVLASLDPTDRALIALRYVAELSSEEIGRALGMSPSGARGRLSRLLLRLRGELRDA